jgi:hypothetical protein
MENAQILATKAALLRSRQVMASVRDCRVTSPRPKGRLILLLAAIALPLIGCIRVTTNDGSSGGQFPSDASPAAVIGSFGKMEPYDNLDSAQARLQFRILQPTDPRFNLVRQGGLLRTLPEVGLPRIEQTYAMAGRGGLIEIVQAPESDPLRYLEELKPFTIGRFEGELGGELPDAGFFFFSGEEVAGQRVRVKVYTNDSSDWTEEDFRDFVESLGFTTETVPPTPLPTNTRIPAAW